jgi:hypothetical protein
LKQSLSHYPASAYLTLLELSHTDFEKTYRFVNNITDFESDSIVYLARGFSATFPAESGDELSQVNLSIWNGDLYLTDDFLNHPKPPKTLKLSLVMATEPDSVIQVWNFKTTHNGMTDEALALTAQHMPALASTFGWITMDPIRFPGLHAEQQAGD